MVLPPRPFTLAHLLLLSPRLHLPLTATATVLPQASTSLALPVSHLAQPVSTHRLPCPPAFLLPILLVSTHQPASLLPALSVSTHRLPHRLQHRLASTPLALSPLLQALSRPSPPKPLQQFTAIRHPPRAAPLPLFPLRAPHQFTATRHPSRAALLLPSLLPFLLPPQVARSRTQLPASAAPLQLTQALHRLI